MTDARKPATQRRLTRRHFVVSTIATVSVASIAGCTTDEDSSTTDDETGTDDSGDTSDTEVEGTTDDIDYDGWFDEADNYGGTEDLTNGDTAAVGVGTGGEGFWFDPPAIRVDEGTEVVWEWTGEGGLHNVVHEGGVFESELTDEAGYTFEHSFEDEGVYRYTCEPHDTMGMRGAVVVGSDDTIVTDADQAADSAETEAEIDFEDPDGDIYFIEPEDGAEVESPVAIEMGAEEFVVESYEESIQDGHGHLHIIIDEDAVSPGEYIPFDDNHIHFVDGETEAELDLDPGTYDLTLQAADAAHRAYDLTDGIAVTVVEG